MNKALFSNLKYMLRKIFINMPGLFCMSIAEGLIWGMIHSVTSVIYLKVIFDLIEEMRPLSEIIYPILFLMVFLLAAFSFHGWYWSYYHPQKRIELVEIMQKELMEKAYLLPLKHYDDPQFYDDFVWSMQESDTRIIALVNDFGKIVNRIVATATMAGIILSIDLLSLVSIFFALAIVLCLNSIHVNIMYNLRKKLMRNNRKLRYIERIFYLKDYAFDLRTSQIAQIFYNQSDATINNSIDSINTVKKRLFRLHFFRDSVVFVFIKVLILLILSFRFINGAISLGEFAAVIGGMLKLFFQLNDINKILSLFKEHSLFIGKYRSFLETCEKNKIQKLPEINENFIRMDIKELWFRYANDRPWVLKNINMSINRGEKIAIVGPNGSGKTTLISLIMRFYHYDKGNIFFNDKDIYEFEEKSYRNCFSISFQDVKMFPVSIAENILCKECEIQDSDRVFQSLRFLKLDNYVQSLKRGINTEISQEFSENGANLSIGQLCRLSLARTLIKDNPAVIILDEPTAPLDPISEYELNKLMIEDLSDQTVLFITHRLSSTKLADRIYYLEDGEIVEQGKHEDLINKQGKYAKMFKAQSCQYEMRNDV